MAICDDCGHMVGDGSTCLNCANQPKDERENDTANKEEAEEAEA